MSTDKYDELKTAYRQLVEALLKIYPNCQFASGMVLIDGRQYDITIQNQASGNEALNGKTFLYPTEKGKSDAELHLESLREALSQVEKRSRS